MRGLYNNAYSLLIFNNSLFSSLNSISFFNSDIFFKKPILSYDTKIFFHPKKFSLEIGNSKSFFEHVLQLRFFLNSFTNSFSYFKHLYFTRLRWSSFKFRKRKNIYFFLTYSAKPKNDLFFFKNFFNFFSFFNFISKRIYKIYFLKIILFKLSFKNNILSFFFLNPHYFTNYIQNKKIIKKDLIVKLNIKFPYKNNQYIYSFLHKIFLI